MAMRWGLGPVFAYEWLTTARRWQVYAVRSLFVAALLVSLVVVWGSEVSGRQVTTIQSLAGVGESFYYALVGTQLALVLLAAPAATAGAICLDKARGTLAHLLVTDLSDAEIVLGKLAARLIPVLGFVACALPVMALGTLLGGIDPVDLAGAFLITLGVALLGATLALTLSVWGTRTHEVLLATYAFWSLWLLANPIWLGLSGWIGGAAPAWFMAIDPFWLAFAPYSRPGSVWLGDHLAFFAACLLASTALTVVAVRKTRPVAARQADRPRRPSRPAPGSAGPRRRWRGWPGPTLDNNPVLWREWHRNRPSRWGRACGLLYLVLASACTLLAIVEAFSRGTSPGELAPWVNGIQAGTGLLLLAVVAATALAEERVRGSLDVLLATPLSTPAIVRGKWWGAYRKVPPLAVLPGLLAFSVGWRHLPSRLSCAFLVVVLILAYGAFLTSLGLALATWIARLGRVVALTVVVHVLVTVGWFFLAFQISGHTDLGRCLAEASPFFGVGMLTAATEEGVGPPDHLWYRCVAWATGWSVVYVALAFALLMATLATFDRCFSRVPDRPGRPRPIAMTKAKVESSLNLE